MYTVDHITSIISASGSPGRTSSREIRSLLADSRQLRDPEGTLFFALQGLRQNGHQFIEDLYLAGVKSFVVSFDHEPPPLSDAQFLVVPDTIKALQDLAAFHRSQHNIPIVAVTGSNGKTIIKEWLYTLLSDHYDICKTPKSYNSQIGVPLSIWQLQPNHNLAIFEAGISQPQEMHNLWQMILPTYGIFSNIGSAHDDGFADRSQKIAEKAILFKNCVRVICCHDHKEVHDYLSKENIPLFTWSMQHAKGADLHIEITSDDSGSTISYQAPEVEGNIHVPFQDQASIQNIAHCLAFIIMFDASLLDTQNFQKLHQIAMRLEVLKGKANSLLINDVYNADLESLSVALAFASFQTSYDYRTLILSDLLQQTKTPTLYIQVADYIRQYGIQRLIAVGEDISSIRKDLPKEVAFHLCNSTQELLESLHTLSFEQQIVIIKGARTFGLERITDQLVQKTHQTVLEINLGALARNIKRFERALVNDQVRIMAMVKAAAYGSGSVEIAQFLQSRNIDYLSVAYTDEGVELRQAGIQLPIMVLNVHENDYTRLVNFDLEPEVFSMHQLRSLAEFCSLRNEDLDIHLKIETGMHRLGFEPREIELMCSVIADSNIRVKSIFSHLAASDDPQQNDFSREQISQFKSISQRIIDLLDYRPLLHIANSYAISYFPEAQFDMVRLGIGMYGIGAPALKLEVVHTLTSYVSQIKFVKSGDTIGYGRLEKVKKNMCLATLPVGYADGLIRKAGNRRYAVVIKGELAPIVGHICMDMTMVDITDIEGVNVGTEVTIFGEHPKVTELARVAETIPYEVFTNLSDRVQRKYTYD